MPLNSSRSKLQLRIIAMALVFAIAGCGSSTIVGKWRLMGGSNAILWEFSANGAVLVGDVRGRYKFGDQKRIKNRNAIRNDSLPNENFRGPDDAARARRFQARVHENNGNGPLISRSGRPSVKYLPLSLPVPRLLVRRAARCLVLL